MKKTLLVGALVTCTLGTAEAVPLKIVEVSAPAINCVFDPSCTLTVTDSTANIALAGAAGTAFLQSRTVKSAAVSPAGGRYAYEYRMDLRQAYGITAIPCVKSLSLTFGFPSTLDYDANGITDEQVFVVTSGGLGSVKPTSADRTGNVITFQFGTPVCAGGSPGNGESTYFFGLAAWGAPHSVTATLKDLTNASYSVAARAPKTLVIARPLPRPLLRPVPPSVPPRP